MTKYLQSTPFQVGGHTAKYASNWDRVFGKKAGITYKRVEKLGVDDGGRDVWLWEKRIPDDSLEGGARYEDAGIGPEDAYEEG